MRKDLGINSELDLIRLDNPELTEKEAIAKLAKIKEEHVNAAREQLKESIIVKKEDDNGQQGNVQD